MHSVYILAGEEEFLKREALSRLEKLALDKGDRDLNYNIFYAPQTPPNQILTQAATLPFLSPKRLILVKDFDKFSSSDREAFLNYAENPRPTTCLVLETSKAKIGEGFHKKLSSNAKVVFFKNPKGAELIRWIEGRMQSAGKKITREAAELLSELAGNNLDVLNTEVQKLAAFVSERDRVNRVDVEELAGKSANHTSFQLLDSIRHKDIDKALSIFKTLLRDGKKEHEVLGLLGWHLRRIERGRRLLEAGVPNVNIGRQLNIPPFSLERFMTQVKKFSKDKVARHTRFLLQADVKIKKGRAKPGLALEQVIVDLCRN